MGRVRLVCQARKEELVNENSLKCEPIRMPGDVILCPLGHATGLLKL